MGNSSLSLLARGKHRTVRTTHGKMTRLIPCLVSLVAAVAAQEAKETPLWFLQTELTGSFRERSDACPGLLAANQEEASFGPIFIPEDSEAQICIRFPARDGRPETWRHDRGSRGACANQCCEFKPPLKNPPPPPLSQLGSRPAETVQLPLMSSTVPPCSEDLISTLRRFVSNLRMEVTSLEKASSVTVEDLAVSFTERLPDKMCSHCIACCYLYQT